VRSGIFQEYSLEFTVMDIHKIDTSSLGIDIEGKPIRVLVADDEFAARKLLGQILKGFGFEVVDLVKDGNEFIQRFWEIPIDIGFLDYNMPHKNGLSTAKDIMKGDPRALLVMTTNFSEKDAVVELLALGIRDFIKKPLVRGVIAKKLVPIVNKVNRYRYPDAFRQKN
jgi:DNA-binding NarL/FixJ family response regulator